MRLLVTLFLSSLLLALPCSSKPSTVYIFEDLGGSIGSYVRQTEDYLNRSVTVKFTSMCASACTMFLAVPDKCVGPDVMFGFHRSYGSTNAKNNYATLVLLSYYPDWVLSWLKKQGGISDQIKWMPYTYAKLHMKACK